MKPITIVFLIFLILSFASGIYFCSTHSPYKKDSTEHSIEGFDPDSKQPEVSCPNLLIKSGNAILLYNTKLPESPGINPLPFYNLDEYINYLDIQRKKGIHCPVLFLQEEVNTQGNSVYRIRPDIFQTQGGLPQVQYNSMTPSIPRSTIQVMDASRDSPPWNSGEYSGFDPTGQNIGQYTNVDAIHNSTYIGQKLSENPMDDNWGGVIFTKTAVDSGKYKENEIVPPSQGGPFVEKSDNVHSHPDPQKASIFA